VWSKDRYERRGWIIQETTSTACSSFMRPAAHRTVPITRWDRLTRRALGGCTTRNRPSCVRRLATLGMPATGGFSGAQRQHVRTDGLEAALRIGESGTQGDLHKSVGAAPAWSSPSSAPASASSRTAPPPRRTHCSTRSHQHRRDSSGPAADRVWNGRVHGRGRPRSRPAAE
jgi:hypothetical protein